MSIDFTSPHLQPHIQCSSCSHDDHPITNLTSGDPLCRNKGFLADAFVRPPLLITIALPCLVELQSIVIDPWVGAQKTCGFEVHTLSEQNVKSWLIEKSNKPSEQAQLSTMEKIGNRFDKTPDTRPVYIFTNRYFRPRSPFSSLSLARKTFPGTREVPGDLRHRDLNYTTRVSHIIIKITGTISGSVPGIKQLAIYGQPSVKCQKGVVSQILQILNAVQHPVRCPAPAKPSKPPPVAKTIPETVPETIPAEYLDELTYEIMTIPLLLPSGHNIDQSTLDKFVLEESKWGRGAGDPFTSVPFDSTSKPVVNSALKARIDQFIVQANIEGVGRTTGRHTDLHNKPMFRHCSSTECPTVNKTAPSTVTKISSTVTKRNNTVTTRSCSAVAGCNPLADCSSVASKRKAIDLDAECPVSKFTRGGDHEQSLKSSLDLALSSTLSSLPSYTSARAELAAPRSQCCRCRQELEPNAIYALPCSHLVCRTCAHVESGCPKCGKRWSTHQVRKVHL